MTFSIKHPFAKFPEDRLISLGLYFAYHDGEWMVTLGLGFVSFAVGSLL